MSKTSMSTAFKAHLAGSTLTVATLIRITRRDGEIFCFTDHDQNITFGGDVYYASRGINPTNIQGTASLSVDNLSTQGPFVVSGIEKTDLEAGRYDRASVKIYFVNYTDPDNQYGLMRAGHLGKIEIRDNDYVTEFRGLKQYLQNEIGQKYSAVCRARLGDDRCKVNLDSFTEYGVVTGVEGKIRFAAEIYERHTPAHTQYNVSGSEWFSFGRLYFRRNIIGTFTTPPSAYTGTGVADDIKFGDGTGTITGPSGKWAGFDIGDYAVIDGSGVNDGTYEVLNRTATVLTLAATFVAEDNSTATVYVYGTNLNHYMDMEVQEYDIASWAGLGNVPTFQLFQSMPFDIKIGDLFYVYAGCQRTIAHCKTKFNNILNRRAEDFVPGPDKAQQTPYGARI